MRSGLQKKTGPDYIQFYPTLRCNRACDFCFNRGMPDLTDMSFGDFRAMLDVLGRIGVGTLDIMGGEPTMHPDVIAFVREATARGYTVNLSSNGSNLDVLSEIMNFGPYVRVGISVNERKTLEEVRRFIQEHQPVVKTVFTPGLDRTMIEQIISLKPKRFYFIYCDVTDRDGLNGAVPFYRFKREVESNFGMRQAGMVYCSGFLPDVQEYPALAGVRCPAGTAKLGVMPDGSVYPCNLFFGKEKFLLGNIFSDSFADIWNHRQLAFFRTFSSNCCAIESCEFRSRCHGGCPAQSFSITGDLSDPDPRCNRV